MTNREIKEYDSIQNSRSKEIIEKYYDTFGPPKWVRVVLAASSSLLLFCIIWSLVDGNQVIRFSAFCYIAWRFSNDASIWFWDWYTDHEYKRLKSQNKE